MQYLHGVINCNHAILYFHSIFMDASTDIHCNTEKDRSRIHHRTAGRVNHNRDLIVIYTTTLYTNYTHQIRQWEFQKFIIYFNDIHRYICYDVGILAGMRPCGIVVLFTELFNAESKSQVYASLHEFLRRHSSVSKNIGKHYLSKCCLMLHIEFICYDDGCHLRKYARNEIRKDLTPTAQQLAKVEIVVDKMHLTGHTDKWCLANCNPHHFTKLDKVIKSILFIS